ncbi:MAG: pilus assembly protein [Lachnospiraceae bacterium]|nr:pilus assembly protein [Lachnospiraceae bacterium]
MGRDVSERNGFVTIEAAFIFPFVIGLIIAMIWLSFYMYAKISALCECDRLLLQEERVYRDTGETDNIGFYRKARNTLTGYPLAACSVSRCYGDYGELVVEYVLGAAADGGIIPEKLSEILLGEKKIRSLKADNRLTKARYFAVGKSIYTKVKGYARGWRNGSED